MNQNDLQEPSDNVNEDDEKSYRTILQQEIETAQVELDRPSSGLFLSGLSAGLDIGFSILLMAVVLTFTDGGLPEPVVHLLVANAYAIGFIFVVLGRSELFTEHTTLAVLPVLDRSASIGSLLRLWAIVYGANLLGAAVFARLATWVAPALGTAEPSAFEELALRFLDHRWWVILLSGILAGWMMGLMSWLVTAGKDTISKIFFVWLVASAIGLLELHHSIAGSVELFASLWLGQIALWPSAQALALATLGNAVGGTVFVALIKYGHAKSGRLMLP